ncbi:helix-turn-helix domain-containing protein [Acetivibrio saccincola]|jgi:DNA invertase Pin-like site-specific DNA recombinase|uniref:Resolvase n=1 Tax=Acetivibrio saccincola TaxID=1677857 RepID=A0A2S8R6N0_9FIRM|nr:helix-turn-helix domain-containing protein [Acetivibrio saccincola]PQQ65447.1 resolvase [Acetivibrio saccincola]
MIYAYFIENTSSEFKDNSGLFRFIQEQEIPEDNLYIDTADNKDELDALLEKIEAGDTIVLRTVTDLAEKRNELLQLLKDLQDFGVLIHSITEPFLNGLDYFNKLQGAIVISKYYAEKKRRLAFEEARRQGVVGRPKIPEKQIETALKLYSSKLFTTEEIAKLSGVSSSTLYRALKEQGRLTCN